MFFFSVSSQAESGEAGHRCHRCIFPLLVGFSPHHIYSFPFSLHIYSFTFSCFSSYWFSSLMISFTWQVSAPNSYVLRDILHRSQGKLPKIRKSISTWIFPVNFSHENSNFERAMAMKVQSTAKLPFFENWVVWDCATKKTYYTSTIRKGGK